MSEEKIKKSFLARKLLNSALFVGVFFVAGVLFFGFNAHEAEAATCTLTTAGTWDGDVATNATAGNSGTARWTGCTGGVGFTPSTTDTVQLTTTQTLQMTASATVSALTFAAASTAAVLQVDSGTFTVTNAITVTSNTVTMAASITGAGAITAASMAIGTASVTPGAAITTILTSTISTFTISANVTTVCNDSTGAKANDPKINLNSGSMSVTGTITLCLTDAAIAEFNLNAGGSQNATLTLSNATPWSIAAGAIVALNGTSSTVNYSGAGQTAQPTTYTNLTLSGSGNKTFATTPTVNGVLSMEDTAAVVVTTGVVTYGSAATLQYNKSGSYTGTTEEWITPFVATGGVIIAGTGAITPPGSVQFGSNTNVDLTINSGATFSPGTNTVTLHGDFINNGTITLAATPYTIAGTVSAQAVGGFTTTGTLSMTKTSGTATLTAAGSTTGNVSVGAFTLNGSGGTLSIGSNTLTISGAITNTAGTLTASSGTVNYSGTGQTILNVTYGNLAVSGAITTGTNTATVSGAFTVSGVFTPSAGTITMNNGGSIVKSAGADFYALGQTPRNWNGMAAAPNGNIYAAVQSGDIYMQTAGAGNFVALSQTSRLWNGMAAAPNGNIYAAVYGGDIYMQTAGAGNFVALSQTSRNWNSIVAAANGNIYAVVDGGDIYMQTAGTGSFVALGQTSRAWSGLAALSNGNIYAAVYGGDIYMQTAGAGDFVALGQTSRNWYPMTASSSGNVYAPVYGSDMYMQTAGTGDFVALGLTSRFWNGMAGASNGNVYAASYAGDIYMQGATLVFQNLTIASGATVTTSSDFSIAGTLTNSSTATFNPSTGTITMSAAGSTISNSGTSLLFNNLTIAATPTAQTQYNTSFKVFGALTVNSGVTFAPTGGTITMNNGGSIVKTVTGSNFNALSQTSRVWRGMAAAPSGNIYAAVQSGDIYMQTAGTGNFVALSQTSRDWRAMAAAPNGNVYAAAFGGDIYMQTAGTGNFVALSQTSRDWLSIAAASNGNIYAADIDGDIYMQTAGTGDFVALGQTTRLWRGMTVAPNGNVYAGDLGGDIYMQTNGTGNFVALGQTNRNWGAMAADINGNIYASVESGDIYMQTAGTGNFVALNQTSRGWLGMAAAMNGNVYASTYSGEIYMQGANITFQGLATGSNSTVVTATGFSIAGTLTNSSSATFIASAGTITMSATGSTISNSGAGSQLNFSGLTIAATPTAQSQYNASLYVSGALTVNSGITLTPTGGTITMSGVGSRIANNGGATSNLIFQGLTIAATPTSQAQYNTSFSVAGALTVNSGITFAPTGGTITLNNGGSIAAVTNSFSTLSQGNTTWQGMTAAPNGNIYAAINSFDIVMQTAGTGNVVALNQGSRGWQGMAAAPNGNIYATVYNGDIYMQTAGTGDFIALGQTSRTWRKMAAAPNGNVYAVVENGDIYMQTAGTGNFVALGQTTRSWWALAAAPNGNVYASVGGGDIYMQTNGTGDFVALGQTSRSWDSMAAAPNGDVYAAAYGGSIYIQTAGTGNFVTLGQTNRNWLAMAAAPNGNIYAAVYNGDMYMQDNNNVTLQGLTIASGATASANTNFAVAGTLTNSSTAVFTSNSGAMTCAGCTIANSGTTLTLNSLSTTGTATAGSSSSFTVSGNLIVRSGTFTGTSNTINVGGNFTNNGTFTANGGTVKMTTSSTAIISSSSAMSFANFTVTAIGAAKTIKFSNAGAGQTAPVFTFTGTVTLNGASGQVLTIDSDNSTNRWLAHFNSAVSPTWVSVSNSGCDAGTSNASVDGNSTLGSNNGSCWLGQTFTISGNIYTNETGTALDCSVGGSRTVAVKINGAGSYTGTCSLNTGAFTISDVTASSSAIATLFISGASEKAAAVSIVAGGTNNITGFNIYQNRLTLRYETGSSITNNATTGLGRYDKDDDATNLFFTANSSALVMDSGYKLVIPSTYTYAPGGNVTVDSMEVAGVYTGASETLVLNGSGTSTTCTDAPGTVQPLCVGGTFTAPATTTYQGTDNFRVTGGGYNTLNIKPAGDSKTATLGATTFTVAGLMTLGNGTNTGVVVDGTANNPTITTTGASGGITIAANTTFQSGTGTITLSGTSTPFTVTGTFTPTTNNTFVYTGNGATAADTTYYNLQLKPSSSTPQVLGFIYDGNMTINGDLTVGNGTNAGASGGGANTPTVTVAGSTTIASGATLTIGDGQDLNIAGDLTVNGTLANDVYPAITVNGNVTGTGTINMTNGEFSQVVTSNKNFGTSSGSNAWTILYLYFQNGNVDSTPVTITTPTGGTGGITTSILTVGYTGETGATILNPGNRVWTLTNLSTPLEFLASPAGTLCAPATCATNTSTFNFDPATNGSSVTVPGATYVNLTLDNTNDSTAAANTFTLSGDVTVSGQVKVGHSSSTNADTFSISTYTLTMSKSGATTNQPLCINNTDCANSVKGLVTFSGGTVKYTGATATTIPLRDSAGTLITYKNLEVSPAGTVTHTLGSAASQTLTVTGNLTLGNGTNSGTITAATNNPTINIGGNMTIAVNTTYTKGTGTTTFNGTTAATYTDNTSTKQNIGIVTLNKTDTGAPATNNKLTLASSVTLDTLTINGTGGQADTFDMASGGYTLKIANAGATATVFTNSGTFTAGNGTMEYTATNSGGNVAITYVAYYNLTLSGAETYTGQPSVVNNDFTINSGAIYTGDGSDYFSVGGNMTGAGSVSGSSLFNNYCKTTACSFGPTGNNDWTVGYIGFNTHYDAGSTATYTIVSGGSAKISGVLAIADSTSWGVVVNNEVNDRPLDLTSFSIGTQGTFIASSTASFTVDDTWTNNGTFTSGAGTVTFDASSGTKALAGTMTGSSKFYNLTFNNAGGTWTFSNSAEVANNFTITAGALTAPSGTLTVGGNFTNSGTFTHNSGTVEFGSGSGIFNPLNQTSRDWWGMAAAPNGNIYSAAYSGDIYMQTAGTGSFTALGQTSRQWAAMAAAPNGNVYASVDGGDIYMQTAGTGNFVALSQTNRNWWSMAAAPNGNVYAADSGGDIYMQTAGTGNFVALGQTSRGWYGMAAAPNGNIYAAVYNGDIYMQTAGTGNFVALSQTTRQWGAMAAAPNGNIYAIVSSGDIYMQTAGTGNFVALGQTSRQWFGMAAAPNGNIYTNVALGDIYMLPGFSQITGATTFNNFSVTTADKNVRFTAGTTYTINGVLTLTGTSGHPVVLNSDTGTTAWTINHQGTESVTYTTVSWSACSLAPSTTITMTGTGNTNGDNNGDCWNFGAVARTISGSVYQSDDATLDTTGYTLKLSVSGGTANTITAPGDGTFSFSEGVNASDVVTIWISGHANKGSLAFRYGTNCTGTPNCTGLRLTVGQVRIDEKNGSSMANSNLAACTDTIGDGCATADIGFDVASSNLTVASGRTLKIATGVTHAPAGNITAPGLNIASTATLTAPSGNLTLSGDFTNNGTFTHNSGTVVLAPSSSGISIDGSSNITFNNLTVSGANGAGKYLKFKDGNTYTFSGAFSVQGINGNPLALSSTTPGSQWTATFSGSRTVDYITVKDSTCSGGSSISPSVNIFNRGNNGSCWSFFSFGGGSGTQGVGGSSSGGGTPASGGNSQSGGGPGEGQGSGGGTPVGGGTGQGGGGGEATP